jgi:predicted nucleotidyltransferase
MSKSRLAAALAQIASELDALGSSWALVGGLAVSARAEPRTTRDVDVAVHVPTDQEAERLVHSLRSSAYEVVATVEQRGLHRLATVRLRPRGVSQVGPVIDLLFASSGIEAEIVRDAERLEVFPDVMVPVARTPHLVAMKLLARDDRKRPQDWDDLRALLEGASPAEVERARELVGLIEQRGAHRGRNLSDALNELVAPSGPTAD